MVSVDAKQHSTNHVKVHTHNLYDFIKDEVLMFQVYNLPLYPGNESIKHAHARTRERERERITVSLDI